jgi:hypothetical protein
VPRNPGLEDAIPSGLTGAREPSFPFFLFNLDALFQKRADGIGDHFFNVNKSFGNTS